MTSNAGRKKSIASSGPNGGLPQIDIPGGVNTLNKKPGSSAVPLYQQCSQVRNRLLRIHDFSPYFSISQVNARQSTDPVHHLWDTLSLGTPLCFLYNLLPLAPASRIKDINADPEDIDPNNIKDKKKAIAAFILGILNLQRAGQWDEGEIFTVGDLLGAQGGERNTNGFVKVVNTVSQLLDRLPAHVFMEEEILPSPPSPSDALDANGNEVPMSAIMPPGVDGRTQVIQELLETERKYVADLEVMQGYANRLRTEEILDQDTVHDLFFNLNVLLDFQRHFLIALEGIAETSWPLQRWGNAFTVKEEQFTVYEPYCANYTKAADVLIREEQNLMVLAHVINPKSELPAFLIKPIQRICKYPLLLESLAKRITAEDYPYHGELLEGLASAKRITDKVNEAQRRAENAATVAALATRVEDWKGHHLSNFGVLHLDDLFVVNKADVDREYHVFLFEKIILCCKEGPPGVPPNSKKVGKTNSILKKANGPQPPPMSGAASKKKTTPLLLKGRIFLNNVTHATPSRKESHSLQVYWRGDEDLEFFTLRCRSEEQMKQWETSITRLVKDTAARRASERAIQQVPHHPTSAHPQQHYVDRDRSSTQPGSQSYNSTPFPPYPPGAHGRAPGRQLTYHDEGISPFPKYVNNHPYGRSQSTEDFERDEDEDWVDTADDRGRYAAPYPVSGRGTPTGNGMNARRAGTPSSMQPPERDTNPAYYERLRARTEDQSGPVMTQFRNGLPPNGLPPMPVGRNPLGPRGLSNTSQMSQMSGMSEASFGTGVSSRAPRSQFSTTKLRQAYEAAEEKPTMPRYQQSQSMGAYPSQQHVRLRSASSPTAFPNRPSISDEVPPPVPPPSDVWGASSDSQGSVTSPEEKRGSNSSNSSSDYSIGQTASPVTPYGSSESNFAGATVRPARSQVFGSNESSGLTRVPSNKMPTMSFNPPVKVKVHYGEDLFVIVVPRSTDYTELVEKVGKKIRLCGGWKEDRPLRVKYRDEEGDMISLRDDDELQMAFETGAAESGKSQPTQITLFVV